MTNKESINKRIINCNFCNVDIRETILDETKHFYIMPSLGSLVEGYILLISKKHINSMSELTKSEFDEYEFLINKYRKIFKEIYKKYPIIFEHGTPNLNGTMQTSSIFHAHTHIVNHKFKNEKDLLRELNIKEIDNLNLVFNNYIFYINEKGKKYITYKFESKSQLIRMKIAEDLNLIDKYDWHKNRFDNNINLTIDKIKNYNKKK